jgi:hypothetical protein
MKTERRRKPKRKEVLKMINVMKKVNKEQKITRSKCSQGNYLQLYRVFVTCSRVMVWDWTLFYAVIIYSLLGGTCYRRLDRTRSLYFQC